MTRKCVKCDAEVEYGRSLCSACLGGISGPARKLLDFIDQFCEHSYHCDCNGAIPPGHPGYPCDCGRDKALKAALDPTT